MTVKELRKKWTDETGNYITFGYEMDIKYIEHLERLVLERDARITKLEDIIKRAKEYVYKDMQCENTDGQNSNCDRCVLWDILFEAEAKDEK